MSARWVQSDPQMGQGFQVLTAQAVETFDIVGLSGSPKTVFRASDQTWNTDLATTQTDFALLFLGVSNQRKVAANAFIFGNSPDNAGNIIIMVMRRGIIEFDCVAATFNAGDFVGPAKDTGNALLNQTVVACSTQARAIGRVVRNYTTNTTKVAVELLTRFIADLT